MRAKYQGAGGAFDLAGELFERYAASAQTNARDTDAMIRQMPRLFDVHFQKEKTAFLLLRSSFLLLSIALDRRARRIGCRIRSHRRPPPIPISLFSKDPAYVISQVSSFQPSIQILRPLVPMIGCGGHAPQRRTS